MMNPWQVFAHCEHCRTESAVVEVYDPLHPATHLGRPTERRCRMCGATSTAVQEPFSPRHPLGENRCPRCADPLTDAAREGLGGCPTCAYEPTLTLRQAAADLTDPDRARAAIGAWATEDGEDDPERFCQANLGLPVDAVIALLADRAVVPTTFDVIAWLFPTAGSGTGRVDGTPLSAQPGPAPIPVTEREPPPFLDPRGPARVLVSVMLADGAIRRGEMAFIRRWLEKEGLPMPTTDDLRVWRANDLPSIGDARLRERLLEACVELVHLDGQRDESEWRVIQDYARCWGISEATLQRWNQAYHARYASPFQSLWNALTGLVDVR
jgi:hypothetical protein